MCVCNVTQVPVCHSVLEEQHREALEKTIHVATKVRCLHRQSFRSALILCCINFCGNEINGDSCKVQGNVHVGSLTSSLWSYTHSSQQSSSQSPLKKLFGLRRSAQSKHNITPVGLDLPPVCFS